MKILMVDFKKKQLQATFDDRVNQRIDRIEKNFLDALKEMHKLNPDELFFDYCVHALSNMILNLKENI